MQETDGDAQTGVYLLHPMKLFNVSNFYCDCNEIDIDIAAINQIGGTANAAIDNNLWNFAAITINKIRKTLEAGARGRPRITGLVANGLGLR